MTRGEPGPRTRAFVDFTLRWGRWLWAIAILLAIPAGWRTAQLYVHLRSDMEELLPKSAPSVVALDELRARMAGIQHLGVVVDAGSADRLPAAERFLDDLATRVRAYPPDLVRSVRTGDSEERKFIEDHAPLYVELADLKTIQHRIEERRDWEASREQGALLDEDDPPPSLDFDDIQHKYEDRTKGARRFDGDRFASPDMHTALMLVEVGVLDTGSSRGGQLLERVRSDVAALNLDSYAPGMRLGYTGDVAINVEELQALVTDLSLSSVLVVVFVIGVIVLYYRWWRSIVVLLPPLLLATIYAFALASLWPMHVTELNTNTAFLGSIIVGNGINFGILLLARYVDERRLGASVRDAMVQGLWGARTGTLSAALAAGVSYASLALTDFRGFRQFGFIGGIGMLLSWTLAFVLVPPLAAWVDRAPRIAPLRHTPTATLVDLQRRHRSLIVALAAVLAGLAIWQMRGFGAGQIETDFSKLRRADTWQTGEGYWGRKMDALLDTQVTPAVMLTDSPEQARAVAAALESEMKHPPLSERIASIRTLDDVVPRDQTAKLAVVDAIRDDLTPHIRSLLTADQKRAVDRLLGKDTLRPITAADVPATFTTGLRERDGTLGRTVLVFPKPSHLLWEGPALDDFVRSLRAAAGAASIGASRGRPARLASSFALSADILQAVRSEGVLTSAAAFFGVLAVVLALLRGRAATALVIGSLLLGVLWLVGAMMALGVKINFVNFIAFPITFGIGVDYAANMAARWEQIGRGPSMSEAVRTTGGAVTLCSLTTIIGYSSLLLAQNRALFLFGVLAVLGELACLSAAVVVLPAFVEWASAATNRHRLRRS
ncbi:MAG TPA: MMPL family transporter [Polyangiaceae bacterium]